MKTVEATPPAGFPAQVIVMDRELGKRHPDKVFYLRVQVSEAEVRTVDLDGEQTLPGALRKAVGLGFDPTHWMETTDGQASLIPDGIAKK